MSHWKAFITCSYMDYILLEMYMCLYNHASYVAAFECKLTKFIVLVYTCASQQLVKDHNNHFVYVFLSIADSL